jgi:anti-sigma regulatory factor (Ser/Thr protein kinase)
VSEPARNEPDVLLRMLSHPRYLSGARELVTAVARRLGFEETVSCQIALAVDEALANVIRHGYSSRNDRPIWVSIWPLGSGPDEAVGIRVMIEDEARQVEPDAIRGRDLEDIRPGGLGVHIIREVMDDARYEKRDSGGMRLVMEKRLPPKREAGATDDAREAGSKPDA